jgi:hypothetical protein
MKTFKELREAIGTLRRRIVLPSSYDKERVIKWYQDALKREEEKGPGGLASVPEIIVDELTLLPNKADAERRTLLAAHHENKAVAMKFREKGETKWMIGAWTEY